jgi:hypothetical protein
MIYEFVDDSEFHNAIPSNRIEHITDAECLSGEFGIVYYLNNFLKGAGFVLDTQELGLVPVEE